MATKKNSKRAFKLNDYVLYMGEKARIAGITEDGYVIELSMPGVGWGRSLSNNIPKEYEEKLGGTFWFADESALDPYSSSKEKKPSDTGANAPVKEVNPLELLKELDIPSVSISVRIGRKENGRSRLQYFVLGVSIMLFVWMLSDAFGKPVATLADTQHIVGWRDTIKLGADLLDIWLLGFLWGRKER